MKYWVSCVSKDHVVAGVIGGYVQSTEAGPLRRLSRGDMVVFYSEGSQFRAGELLQAFTAIGRVTDTAPSQVTVTPVFKAWRLKMTFIGSEETPIEPLVPELAFITDKLNWGLPRRGLFEISAEDFARVAQAMDAEI